MRHHLLIAIFLLSLPACGKKGPLYYPDMLIPSAPSATTVSQVGSSARLQFVLPDTDRSGRKLLDLDGVDISKRESGSSDELACSSCMTDYTLFRKLYLKLLPDGVQRYGNRILVLDVDVSVGKTYSYSVVPFNNAGVYGLASPQVSVSIVQPANPPVLQAESFPTEIRISFASLSPLTGTFIGYNLYRSRQEDLPPQLPINREPLTGKDYVDSPLERNVKYRYMARTVVKQLSGGVVESQASNVVEGMLKDDE